MIGVDGRAQPSHPAKGRLNARKTGDWESSQLRLTLAEDAVLSIRQSSLPAKASLEPWPPFTDERKVVLDAIRDELRKRDYVPVLFDFEKPSGQTAD